MAKASLSVSQLNIELTAHDLEKTHRHRHTTRYKTTDKISLYFDGATASKCTTFDCVDHVKPLYDFH